MDTQQKLIQKIGIPLSVKQIPIQNYSINYIVAGKGSPLLLIHGGNIGWAQWYPNIAELAKNFKVYAIDLPGGGRSSRVDFSKLDLEKDFVEVVTRFIKKLDLTKLNIVGSSIGGWIAVKLAIREDLSISKLVLADAVGFSDYMQISDRVMSIYPLVKFLTKTVLKPVKSNPQIEKFLRSVFNNQKLPLWQEFIDFFYETMETSHNILLISRLSGFWRMRQELILTEILPKVKQPTLIIWGEKDKLMPLDKYSPNFQLIPNVITTVIKDAGHIPSIEKSGEFNTHVVKFLSK